MSSNHILLETIELTQDTASVVLNNIPQSGYTDLKLVTSLRASTTANWALMSINGGSDTATNLLHLIGSGATAASQAYSSGRVQCNPSSLTANVFAVSEVYIPNYLSTGNKSMSVDGSQENNASSQFSHLAAFLWTGTAAINSIGFTVDGGGNFVAGSTFSIYGVAAVGTTPTVAPKATGGNIVANDGTYWYHAFLTSGTFTPQTSLSCDVLVVAGGGAGGGQNAGGGGAGGLLSFTSQSLSATNYACTVGAGGTSVYNAISTNGSNSQFGSLTASVGGGAGGFFTGPVVGTAQTGGSGGGAAGIPGNNLNGGSGTSGQGNAGGNTTTSVNSYAGGGGGGASAVGSNVTSSEVGGAGGIGTTSALLNAMGVATNTGQLSSGNYYYAGGGGGGGASSGGSGGIGGGGAGRDAGGGLAGTANTGGGGGGSRGANAGGFGGSGIVIVRYAI